jgi:hypothetical protein
MIAFLFWVRKASLHPDWIINNRCIEVTTWCVKYLKQREVSRQSNVEAKQRQWDKSDGIKLESSTLGASKLGIWGTLILMAGPGRPRASNRCGGHPAWQFCPCPNPRQWQREAMALDAVALKHCFGIWQYVPCCIGHHWQGLEMEKHCRLNGGYSAITLARASIESAALQVIESQECLARLLYTSLIMASQLS